MNNNLSSIFKTSLFLLLGFVFIYFFFRFLPILLVMGLAIYAFFKIKGKAKKWTDKKEYDAKVEEKIEEENFEEKYDLTNKNVVEVEYYEVKK